MLIVSMYLQYFYSYFYLFIYRYPPLLNLKEGEKLGTIYNFKGSKTLSTVTNSLTNKLKLEYEVFVRIVDDVSEWYKTTYLM